MYGKKAEYSIGDIKSLEDNQMDKLEDKQPEQGNSEIGSDFGYSSI